MRCNALILESVLAGKLCMFDDNGKIKMSQPNPPTCKQRDKCQPTAEYALWMEECHETNHDEDGKCVGESWPGYVTFDEWKKLRKAA